MPSEMMAMKKKKKPVAEEPMDMMPEEEMTPEMIAAMENKKERGPKLRRQGHKKTQRRMQATHGGMMRKIG